MSYTNKGFDSEEKRDGGSRQAEGQDSLPRICIIGSGDFGRALASRLGKSGYRVTIASRDISRNRLVTNKYHRDRRTVEKLNVK